MQPAPAPAPASRTAPWQRARRVLAVRLDNLGDVLMTTPALAALRDTLPGAHVTLLCSPAGAAAAAHLPMVDAAWPFTAPWMRADTAAAGHAGDGVDATLGQAESALIDRLAEARFDAAVIFTVCTQSALPAALLCRLAGIPLRLAHCRENPYALLTDWVAETDVPTSGMRHEVQRQLALVAAVGMHTSDQRLRFSVRAADRTQVALRLRAVGIDMHGDYAVLHPGATAASRRWPAERFGSVAATLARNGVRPVFSGDGADLPLVAQAVTQSAADGGRPAATLAGQLSLGELAALIEGAGVLVANNSAPAHIAAAVGTPVANLYALTNPQHTPWQVPSAVLNHDVPCRWCLKSVCPQRHHDCLRQVTAERVGAAALTLMPGRLPSPRASIRELQTP